MSLLFKKAARPSPTGRLFEPPSWEWSQSGEVGWWVRADWSDALLGPSGLRLEEWREQGRLTVIKKGPQRVVYRADLPEGAFYIKHYLVPDFRAKLRQWVRRGKGRNEGQRTAFLGAIGVPTITPVALGEQRRRQVLLENYLVTHAIPDAVPLDTFVERRLPELPEPRRSRVRRELAVGLAELTARLHDAGIVHIDFHPGNVLVQLDPEDRPRLAMIDLDALRVTRPVWQFWEDFARLLGLRFDAQRWSPPLTWPEAMHNLALLNHYFWLRSGRVDRCRFLRAYLKARTGPFPETAAFASGIETATRRWAERLWRRWGKRCQGTNKYFWADKGPRTWSVSSRSLDGNDVRALLQNPDGPFVAENTTWLKRSRFNAVAETTMTVDGVPTRVIYKRFHRKCWYEPFFTYFRPSRAWQSWQAAQHLASRALPTPRNLAFVARMRRFPRDLFWYLPHETYLVTVKEENVVTLGEYVRATLPTLGPAVRREQIRRLTLELARLLRTMHERSLSHRDLKASNILLLGEPATPEFRLTLIDLVGVRLIHPLPRHRRVQNLARLSISLSDALGRTRTDSLRFLRAYLDWGLSPLNDWKGLWRAVAGRSREKIQRNTRKGRELS